MSTPEIENKILHTKLFSLHDILSNPSYTPDEYAEKFRQLAKVRLGLSTEADEFINHIK